MNDNFTIKNTVTEKLSRFNVTIHTLDIDGHEQEYSYININPGVCVIPVYKNKIICIRQYRFPVRSWEYEFPGGFIDEGEAPCDAARRELEEETGLKADKMIDLGFFHPSFGSTNEKIYLFAALCDERGETHRELAEFIEMKEFSAQEFSRLAADGEFHHGAGLAAWLRFSAETEFSSIL